MKSLLLISLFIIYFVACDKEDLESIAENEANGNDQLDSPVADQEVDEQEGEAAIEDDEGDTEETMAKVDEHQEITPNIFFSGKLTLTDEKVIVDAQSNLPADVHVELRASASPYGGRPTTTSLAYEKIEVDEEGNIRGSASFDESFFDSNINELITLELRFDPARISSLHDQAKEMRSIYGGKKVRI